jgi:hypothetical protein
MERQVRKNYKSGEKREDYQTRKSDGLSNEETFEYEDSRDEDYKKINQIIKGLKFKTPQGALKYLKHSSLSHEERMQLWEELGEMYEKRGELKRAEKWFNKSGNHRAIAEMYEKRREYRKAGEYWALSHFHSDSPEYSLKKAVENYETYEAQHPILSSFFNIDLFRDSALANLRAEQQKKKSGKKTGLEEKAAVPEMIILLMGVILIAGLLSTNFTGFAIANLSQTSLNLLSLGILFFILLGFFLYIRKKNLRKH